MQRLAAHGSVAPLCEAASCLPQSSIIVVPEPACEDLRALRSAFEAPILALLPEATPVAVSAALEAGADDCLALDADGAALGLRLAVLSQREQRAPADPSRQLADADYRSVVEGTSDALYVMDRGADGEFRCAVINRAYTELLDRPADVVIGKTLYESHEPEQAERILARYRQAIETRGPVQWEWTNIVGGEERSAIVQVTPLFRADGVCYRLLGSMRNITERKKTEEALRRAEEYLRTMVDSAPLILIGLDRDGRFTFSSGAGLARLGKRPGESVGQSFFETYGRDPSAADGVRAALAGHAVSLEIELAGFTWDCHYNPMLADSGEVTGVIGVILDVTERRHAERTLVSQRAFMDETIDSLPVIFYLVSGDGRFVRTNADFRRVTQYSEEELRDLNPRVLFEDYEREPMMERGRSVLDGGNETVEADVISKDGSRARYILNGKRITFEGQPCVAGMGIDISDYRRAETARRESQADLAAVFESSRDAIVVVGPDRRILTCNGAAARGARLVFDVELAPGTPVSAVTLPGDEATFEGHFEAALRGVPGTAERPGRAHGQEYWFEYSYTPVRMESGEIRGVALTCRDVTGRKRAEEALRQAQKLESLGILAGGIAHDFNNLLVGILGNAGLALAELPAASPARPTLEDIQTAGRRAADLARQMLAYSGKGRFVIQHLDLNALVAEMTHLLGVSISKGAILTCDFTNPLPLVEADATQLRQVVMNLVVNASDAIADAEGVIKVSTGVVHAAAADLAQAYLAPELPEGDYVYLDVLDTGTGMTPQTMARIFDPFFTTKFTGRGLGLAAVLGIVRGHRGAIKVTSEPGRGTTFRLLLPAIPQVEEVAGLPSNDSELSAEEREHQWRGSGVVLVVDDEPSVRAVTGRALATFGFEVIDAADGQHGLDRFAEREAEIVCVLLDMTMPRMSGEEAFVEMHRRWPHVPIVLMSGYSEGDAAPGIHDRGLAAFIQKPYDIRTLRDTLRQALESSES
jgi:PAS domain S-box-containing protein